MVVSHGNVCFVQQAHNTNSGNKRRNPSIYRRLPMMGMLASRLLPPLPELLLLLLERPGIARPWPELTGKIVHLTFRASYFVHAKLLTQVPLQVSHFGNLLKAAMNPIQSLLIYQSLEYQKTLLKVGVRKSRSMLCLMSCLWHLTRVRR